MALALMNLDVQPFTVTLYHGVFCKAAGKCGCAYENIKRPVRAPDGRTGFRQEKRLIPQSVSIAARGRVIFPNKAILEIPQVKVALNGHRPKLRAVLTPEDGGAPPKVAPSPTQKDSGGESAAGTEGSSTDVAPRQHHEVKRQLTKARQ